MKCVENSEQFEAAFLISLSIFIQVLLKLHIYLLLKVTIDHTLGSALRLQHSCSHGNKKRDFFFESSPQNGFFPQHGRTCHVSLLPTELTILSHFKTLKGIPRSVTTQSARNSSDHFHGALRGSCGRFIGVLFHVLLLRASHAQSKLIRREKIRETIDVLFYLSAVPG